MKELAIIIDYIEEHLSDTIDMRHIETLANMSIFNFQKVFSILSGISLGEYIRKRRLSHSWYDLKETKTKIIDIAFKYNYQSSEAYSRAFQQLFHVSPSYARKEIEQLTLYPRLRIRVDIQGGDLMEYHIVTKPAFLVTGTRESYLNLEEGQRKIPTFWDRFNASDLFHQVVSEKDASGPNHVLGICLPGLNQAYDYFIGVQTATKTSNKYLETITLPETKWAVFQARGPVPDAIRQTYQDIYGVFFQSTHYEPSEGPDFESYPLDLDPFSANHITEIWLPLKN